MVDIGCLAKYFNSYGDEVKFAKDNNFKLMQLWYDNDGLALHEKEDKVELIKRYNFPTIIHAVLDVNEFEEHIPKVLEILKELDHKELIIHPICGSEEIKEDTIYKLSKKVKYALDILTPHGIKVFLENNSRLTPLFASAKEIEIIFNQNPELEFLLDIAHIENYEHLEDMVSIKVPKILHIADSHFDVIHEHVPIGQGEIDFNYIFKEVLPNYNGKIILEVVKEDEDIKNSKLLIEKYLKG